MGRREVERKGRVFSHISGDRTVRALLKRIDDSLWRFVFGEADYMQLRPSAGKRIDMLLPKLRRAASKLCYDPVEEPSWRLPPG